MVVAQHGMLISGATSFDMNVSYLADSVLLFRFFEDCAQIHQAISVFKKRTGPHERTIRKLTIDASGLRVGEPLHGFRGIMTGVASVRLARAGLVTRSSPAVGSADMVPTRQRLEDRVLVLMPNARDAQRTVALLRDESNVGSLGLHGLWGVAARRSSGARGLAPDRRSHPGRFRAPALRRPAPISPPGPRCLSWCWPVMLLTSSAVTASSRGCRTSCSSSAPCARARPRQRTDFCAESPTQPVSNP